MFHIRDAVQIPVEFFRLAGQRDNLFLLQPGRGIRGDDPVDFLHPFDRFADRHIVGQNSAHPAFGNVVHSRCFRGLFHDLLRLALRPDEENASAVHHRILQEVARIGDLVNGFRKINDGNSVFGTVHELFHLGVPAFRLMSEMTSGFEQIFHGDRHSDTLFLFLRRFAPVRRTFFGGREDVFFTGIP